MSSAVAYIRVSTEGQVTDGVTWMLSSRELKHGAKRMTSACLQSSSMPDQRKTSRQSSAASGALQTVCQSGGILIVYSLSRLARSTKDTNCDQ